jgi:signal transduction histidine kinase
MREVSCETAALLLDALEQRGLGASEVWRGLPVYRDQLRDPRQRIDWETWVEMMQRAEDACGGPTATETLFVRGAGARTGHPFVRLASAFVSMSDLYRLFARWGLERSLQVARGRFDRLGETHARFTAEIDAGRRGSLPTLRFIVGVLTNLPTLQGLDPALVSMLPDATPHRAEYRLVLPRETRFLPRARRFFSVARGTAAALDALEDQASEIATKNVELEEQLVALRAAKAALEERDAWLELALDAGRVAIWQVELSSGRIRGSAGLGAMVGLPAGVEPTLERGVAAIHADDRERIADVSTRSIAVGAPYEVDYRVERADGIAWLRAKASVLSEPGGTRLVVGTVADVTTQKSLEARLRSADRFIAAGTLAAGVAHEINNPLSYLLGNVELMRRRLETGSERERFAEALDDMADGLGRIRDVVRDLSTLARPDEDVVGALDVRRVIDAAIRIVTPSLKHRTRVETRYADDVPLVLANESRLGQVLMNLLLNASQAMPERPRSESLVEVRARREGSLAVLEVADNGTGIAPAHLGRVFDPFFTTKDVGVGTGLGLSVCRGIVEALGGRIEVESEIGQGATFRVSLPAAPITAGSARPAPREGQVGGRVLLVDDEPLVRRAVSQLLAARGYEVEQADGVREALSLLEAGTRFDVVVCDVMMPEASGAELHARLLEARPELAPRMVFVTGGAVTESTRAFLDRSAAAVVHKPFELAALAAAIESVRSR